MKRYVNSSLVIDERYWKELKAKIESCTSDFLKKQNLNDEVDFYVDVTINHVPDSFTSVASLKISIGCWYKSSDPFDALDYISAEDAYALAEYLNSIFVDTDGNDNYFSAYKTTLGRKPSTWVDAEFPAKTKFDI